MRRILALLLVCVTCFLCACDEALFGDTQDDVQDSASENNQSFIKVDGVNRFIIMPISKVEIKLEPKYHDFIPYITEELLEAAEKDIVAIKGKVEPRYCTFFTTSEGYLHIQEEYIEMVDPEKIANGYEQVPPCGDHRHSGCGGCISSQPLEQFIKKTTSSSKNTIKAMSDVLVKTSKDPIETPTETPPGELPPVEQLRRVDPLKLEKATLYFKEKTEAIIVFLRRNEERWERTIVITPEVLMVVSTGFGHPRQFSYLNSVQVNYIKGASIISPEDYKRFKEYKEILDEIAAAKPDAVKPEEDFKGEVFYGYMTADSFDIYDQNTLEKIFADNGYDSSCFDAFEEMYERFGIADIINPPKE